MWKWFKWAYCLCFLVVLACARHASMALFLLLYSFVSIRPRQVLQMKPYVDSLLRLALSCGKISWTLASWCSWSSFLPLISLMTAGTWKHMLSYPPFCLKIKLLKRQWNYINWNNLIFFYYKHLVRIVKIRVTGEIHLSVGLCGSNMDYTISLKFWVLGITHLIDGIELMGKFYNIQIILIRPFINLLKD